MIQSLKNQQIQQHSSQLSLCSVISALEGHTTASFRYTLMNPGTALEYQADLSAFSGLFCHASYLTQLETLTQYQ